MKWIFIFLGTLPASLSLAQDPWKNVYSESAWKDRDAWQQPQEIIKYMNIDRGAKVADIGCHEGYMTVKLAHAVGATGNVYAVDVNQGKLDKLSAHLKERNIKNVTPVKGDYDNPKLSSYQLDAVVIIDTYHEMDDHDEILKHILKALKPGARLIICEPIAEARRKSPRSDQERRHELGMNYALEDLKKAGFEIVLRQDPFADRSKIKGDVMWIIVARKPA
jgi:tRNA A58 N-methylase Trm61